MKPPLVQSAHVGRDEGRRDLLAVVVGPTDARWPRRRARANELSSGAGRNSLFVDISTWLDAVETRLGRAPIIYTGVLRREQFNAANFPNLPDMSVYPLWTAHPIPVAEDDHARRS